LSQYKIFDQPVSYTIMSSKLLLQRAAFAVPLALFTLNANAQTARITVDAMKVMNTIPAKMYGSCIEDVNHEIYGGLYDQRLYGESFEEPAPPTQIMGWKTLNGRWKIVDGSLFVKAGDGDKLIREAGALNDGSVETDIKFTRGGNNAGVIVRVGREQAGLDDFDGYEISLSPTRQMLVLGKHMHNFKLLKEVKHEFDKSGWTHLKVELKGATISIYLDNNPTTPSLQFTDDSTPLLTGKIGLRTFHADALFKDITIKENGSTLKNDFVSKDGPPISNFWDGITAPTATVKFSFDTLGAYNGKQAQVIEYLRGTGKAGVANNGLGRWALL
jgi:hypothetical protein